MAMYNSPYGGMYNPVAPMQQRLQQYEQQGMTPNYGQGFNQAYGQQGFTQNPSPQNMIKCRAVTSIDEAKAAMIDLDGSMTIFTDLGHNRIYTKQINLDGTATLNSYALEQKPVDTGTVGSSITEERIENIEQAVLALKGEIDNVKSNADITNDKPVKKQSKSNGNASTDVRK